MEKRVYEYAEIVAIYNQGDEYGEERWDFEEIKVHIWSSNL